MKSWGKVKENGGRNGNMAVKKNEGENVKLEEEVIKMKAEVKA